MNNTLLAAGSRSTTIQRSRATLPAQRRSLERILAPLDELARDSDQFFRKPLGRHTDGSAVLPRPCTARSMPLTQRSKPS